MNELQFFTNSEFGTIRMVYSINNEPFFCMGDICRALDIKNVSDAKTRLKEDGVVTSEVIDSLGRKQKANFVNESNMYKLIFQSRKESAERFTDWVTSEILPSIRKHGIKDNLHEGANMNELITVNFDTQTVSARELHAKLNIGTRFNDWFPRMCEYGFEEGKDFCSKMSKTENGGRPSIDYEISVDMAKQICMIQRTPEGKACRQYLIDLEKAWNTPEQIFARALKLADRTIESLKNQNMALISDNERMKPKEIFADAVSTSDTCILIGDLAKLLKQNGINTGAKRMFDWMRNHGYLVKRKGTDYNMPTQKSMEMGLFEVKESITYNPDGSSRINRTTKVTGKGQQYFVNKFLNRESA